MKKELVIPGINDKDIYALYNTKDYAQYETSVKNLLEHRCPFCSIETAFDEILFQNSRWIVAHSRYPQPHQDYHIIIAHRKHIGHISELELVDWNSLHHANKWLNANFTLAGGGLSLRFGDPKRNAASVINHLHWNVQIPKGTDHVSVILCKNAAEIAAQQQRALVYEKIRTGTPYENLSVEDKEIIKDRYPTLKL